VRIRVFFYPSMHSCFRLAPATLTTFAWFRPAHLLYYKALWHVPSSVWSSAPLFSARVMSSKTEEEVAVPAAPLSTPFNAQWQQTMLRIKDPKVEVPFWQYVAPALCWLRWWCWAVNLEPGAVCSCDG